MCKRAFLAMHLAEHEPSVCFDKQSQPRPVRFAEIWLMLLLQMLISYERKNIVPSLKSTVEVVLKNMTCLFNNKLVDPTRKWGR
jgi:hypothetical protein